MAMARFQSAGSSSTMVPVGSRMAAPFTSTRGLPCTAIAALTASAMLASLVTSQRCDIAAPLMLLMRAAVSLAAASSMSRQATLAPASARANAMARPMPSAAPTMMADLPSSRKGLSDIELTPIVCDHANLYHQPNDTHDSLDLQLPRTQATASRSSDSGAAQRTAKSVISTVA